MTVYSHSRLSAFEQCPLKYKLRYIDKAEPEFKTTAEAFLGSACHDALEKLYKMTKFRKVMTKEELIAVFEEQFSKWDDGIKIVREGLSKDNFHEMGVKFLSDYYERFYPFDADRLIWCEEKVLIDFGKYHLQGIIDRLSTDDKGLYLIHDYKTANTLPPQEKADDDRQLALYSIAVKERFKDCREVKLIWHYLAFNRDIESSRTDEELEELKASIGALIDQIEAATEFPPKEGTLCNWCEYRHLCPNFKHLYKISGLVENEYMNEDGVSLVNKYMDLKKRKDELSKEIDKVKEAILAYAQKEGMRVLYGNHDRITIWSKECVKFPSKNDPLFPELVKLLKSLGKFDEFATLDTWELSKRIEAGELDDIRDMLKAFIRNETISRLYPRKM